ncbi:hypothetical protein Tco_0663661, partial [Tanacetum coccineum]
YTPLESQLVAPIVVVLVVAVE